MAKKHEVSAFHEPGSIRKLVKGLASDSDTEFGKFLARVIIQGDPSTITLKFHLTVEALLAEAIAACLPSPEKLEIDRLSYSQKAKLAAALGLLESYEEEIFMGLNGMRNAMVHDLEFVTFAKSFNRVLNSVKNRFTEGVKGFSEQLKQAGGELPDAHATTIQMACVIAQLSGRVSVLVENRKKMAGPQVLALADRTRKAPK